jgi:hypothetical protein
MHINKFRLGFEVLSAVTMKNRIDIFWDVTLCSPVVSPMFWRNILSPSSGTKSKPSEKPGSLFLAGCSSRLWWWMQFLRNVCELLPDYASSRLKRYQAYFSQSLLWEPQILNTTSNHIHIYYTCKLTFLSNEVLILSKCSISLKQHFLCKIWGFHGGDYDDYHLLGEVLIRATRRHLPEDDNHQHFLCFLNCNKCLSIHFK